LRRAFLLTDSNAKRLSSCYSMLMEFEWNDEKAKVNSSKHGVSFEEAK